jgi:hypothetical protein
MSGEGKKEGKKDNKVYITKQIIEVRQEFSFTGESWKIAKTLLLLSIPNPTFPQGQGR